MPTPSRTLAVLCLAAALASIAPGGASAEWRRTTDLNYNTAFTLEQGKVEIGLFTPFTVGATDELQVAIHPVLLLLGQPYLALRWRVTREQDVTVALNLGGTWSFIRREDAEGNPASGASDVADIGYPGTLQLVGTATFRLGDEWLLSVGTGPAVDFLGLNPVHGMAEGHLALHWLLNSEQLLMLQATGYLQLNDEVQLRRPVVEVIYAVSLSSAVHMALGIGLGSFVLDTESRDRQTLNFFPVFDLWFRL